MADSREVRVRDLRLDLANYRTVQQSGEAEAVQAMVSTSPDRFWALVTSLLDDGYLVTESILVLEGTSDSRTLTVKEGNRRVAALKLIYGLLPIDDLEAPEDIQARLKSVPKAWKTANSRVPCTVFPPREATVVDRIVARAHGKNEKAGRDQWNAVATARHNRDFNKVNEPALDLLEKYLRHGKQLTGSQRERWAGDYPLSVLREALQKLAGRFGATSPQELAAQYPKVARKVALERILQGVGLKQVTFAALRDTNRDVGEENGLPALPRPTPTPETAASVPKTASLATKKAPNAKTTATAVTDSRSVKAKLKQFHPMGPNREKVVQLRDEAKLLDVAKTPLAFCFVLRSMFELSAKAYCMDHAASGGPRHLKADGSDRRLADVLGEVTQHLSKNGADKTVMRTLHGAMTELGKSEGILSVTSMNQLLHSTSFSIAPADICRLFGNIYPLLEAMNQ